MDYKTYFKVPANVTGLQQAQLRLLALNMRLAGLPWSTIADVLQVPEKDLYRLVMKDLKKVGNQIAKRAKELHTLEWSRMEALTLSAWPAAMSGNVKAIEVLLKIMERRAKMMGLDAPTKIEQKTANMNFALSDLSDTELRLRAQQVGLNLELLDSVPGTAYLPGEATPQEEWACDSEGFVQDSEPTSPDVDEERANSNEFVNSVEAERAPTDGSSAPLQHPSTEPPLESPFTEPTTTPDPLSDD